jgi:hypothetical protein
MEIQSMKPRLHRDRVLEIARLAAADTPYADEIGIASLKLHDNKLIWTVLSATVGQQVEVTIDDASEKVTSVKTVGVR